MPLNRSHDSTAGRVLCLASLIMLMVLLSGVSYAGGTVAGDTSDNGVGPAPPAAPSLTDPSRYFTGEEMALWKSYQMKRLYLHIVGVVSVLLFYAILFLAGLNRWLKEVAHAWTDLFYRSARLRLLGSKFPILPKAAGVFERLFGGKDWPSVLLYCILFLILLRITFFAYNLYGTYVYDRTYGLSTYTIGLWLLDYLKNVFIGALLLSTMIFGIYGLMNRLREKWWIALWFGVSIGIVGYAFIAPYRSHLYSHFAPLTNADLRERLVSLAHRQGVTIDEILVVDASRRTKKVNAYFQGAGETKRIVLYDTLVDRFTPREIEMVVAHELAHWQEPHTYLSYAVFDLTVFLILGLAHKVLVFGSGVKRLHYTSMYDIAGLPVLFITFFICFQLVRPCNLAWARHQERTADRRSLEMVCDAGAFIHAHVKMARFNYSYVDPNPLLVLLFASHPPFRERIEVALASGCPMEVESGMPEERL